MSKETQQATITLIIEEDNDLLVPMLKGRVQANKELWEFYTLLWFNFLKSEGVTYDDCATLQEFVFLQDENSIPILKESV